MPGEGGYSTFWGTIDIGDNVFIGSNTTILGDVKIGSNVVIGAGSLVNRSIPDGKVVAGVPAKVVCEFSDFLEKRKQYSDSPLAKMKREERLRYLWRDAEEYEGCTDSLENG